MSYDNMKYKVIASLADEPAAVVDCPRRPEIIGVDLRREMDELLKAQILDVWHENQVILLRNQQLSEDDQVRFAESFGPPATIHTKQIAQRHPAVMLISNIREDGKPIGALPDGEMHFHSDQCYQERPAMASMLYAIEVPSKGGNTLFANAYRHMKPCPQRSSGGSRAAARSTPTTTTPPPPSAAPNSRGRAEICAPRRAHSSRDRSQGALRQSPDDQCASRTCRKQRATNCSTFCSITRSSANFIYEHVWRVGDILMWDNRCALHARTDFSADERRLMRRVTILGEKPE